MAESRLIQKQLAGKEDLLLGIGTVKQRRASGIKTITKLNATHFGGVLVVDTINDLNSLDKNQLDEQTVFVKETGDTYSYNGTSWVNKTTTITVENIEDLATYTGSDTVIVKDINRGGIFVVKTGTDIDPNTGSVYTVNDGTVFAKLGGGFWVRQFSGPVNIKWYGAKGDGVTDNATALQAAINSGVKKLRLDVGHYRINRNVIGTENLAIEGSGPDTILDFYDGTGQLRIEGSYTPLPAPYSQVLTNQAWVTFSSAPDLQPGDVFFLYNPTDFSWNGVRAYYRKGEFLQVHSVVGNRVNIYGGTSDSYATGTFNAYKVNPVCLNLSNLRLIESNTPSHAAVKVVFGVGVRISNVYGSSSQYTSIELERCYDFAISDVSVLNNSASTADEYGITLSNCQKGYIRGGGTSATRHAIAIGGSNYVGCVPCRHIMVSDMDLANFNTLPADGGGAAPVGDMHSNSEFITYDNCVFRNGAPLNGGNNTIRNSTIFSMQSDAAGCAIYGSEVVHGVMTVENCVIYIEGNGNTSSQGFITVKGGEALMDNATVIFRNITFKSYGTGVQGNTADLINMMVNTAVTTAHINVIVDGIHIENAGKTFRSVLMARSIDGTTPISSSLLSVDNVTALGSTGGAYLIYPHITIASVPTKEMSQSGSVEVDTTTTNSIAVPTAQVFKFRYSRLPVAQVSVSSLDGLVGSFVGSDAPVPRIYALTRNDIRPAVITPNATNYTAVQSLRLHWTVGI